MRGGGFAVRGRGEPFSNNAVILNTNYMGLKDDRGRTLSFFVLHFGAWSGIMKWLGGLRADFIRCG